MADRRRENIRDGTTLLNLTDVLVHGDDDPDSQRVQELEAEKADLQKRAALVFDASGEKMDLFGCTLSGAGLLIPDAITPAQMGDVFHILFSFEDHIQLMVGDALVGQARLKYGTTKEIAKAFRRDPSTLTNWKSVCKSVKLSLRSEVLLLHPNAKPLTITHYELIRIFNESEQRYWIARALAGDWSVAKLRSEIRKESGQLPLPRRTKYQIFEDSISEIVLTVNAFDDDQRKQAIFRLQQVVAKLEAG